TDTPTPCPSSARCSADSSNGTLVDSAISGFRGAPESNAGASAAGRAQSAGRRSGIIPRRTRTNMDRFKQIETFVAVAARGSLSSAAQAEGVAPAVIGRRIDALEERLGVKLLVRTTRRITLTFEGSAFLEDCQRLLNDFYDAEASVSLGGVKASGHLRVTAPAGFGRVHVAPLLPAFLDAHRDVSISLDLTDRLVDIVNEGIDVAIRIG